MKLGELLLRHRYGTSSFKFVSNGTCMASASAPRLEDSQLVLVHACRGRHHRYDDRLDNARLNKRAISAKTFDSEPYDKDR